ncbi:YciI-like protein [Pseudochrobactrum sp. MP213Fo]|uniref:YciI-like protein n=1 Tax=Pseudochrobactrum sp. MP213Fo TaxID=3022250 RepID=UPI003BA1DDE4
MLFAILCNDKADHLQLRLDTRPAHLDYLKSLGDKIKFGGPFLSTAEQKPDGSMLMVDVDSIEEAKAIAAADPYALAGLFDTVDIRAWNWVINKPAA